MVIAALFTIAKTGKQHKCPLTDEWIKKMWYVYIDIDTTRKTGIVLLLMSILNSKSWNSF